MILISLCCDAFTVYILCRQNARVSVSEFFCQIFFLFSRRLCSVFGAFAAVLLEDT
jgi:hypothetical protein